jgi:hypothetical protein
MPLIKMMTLLFAMFYLLPLGIAAFRYRQDGPALSWRDADRSSAGLLEPASTHKGAVVRVFAARTVSWRGIFATHCWIVLKPEGGSDYSRFDYTAWGSPIRMNGFDPDGRWFGQVPQTVFAADGDAAAVLIPRMLVAIRDYPWRSEGDYRAWPGPNSNSFVSAVMDAVPEAGAILPSTAIGKAYPYNGRWLRRTGTGFRLTLGGYGGIAMGWHEGIEVDILGAVAGVDVRRPAIKLPGLGRIGMRLLEDDRVMPASSTRISAAPAG